jgi:MOSC domain-containing protein YiiM
MHIVSINVGRRKRLEDRSFQGETGIFKESVAGPVIVDQSGLEGDAVVDTRHHGGPDQALYLYRQEDYDWWSEQLQQPLLPGTFGDNLTVSGLPSPGLVIGSRLAFDSVVLQVSAPRIPCNTLAARMGDAGFVKRFMAAERPGVYCRVLTRGRLAPGEEFSVAHCPGSRATTIDLFRAAQRRLSATELREFLALPIDERTRRKFASKLQQLEG